MRKTSHRHPLRALLYGRVSKDQRSGRSVKQQLTIGRRRVTENGWINAGEYSDNDRSASQYARRKREDWERLMADINRGLGDILWLWEISRGTRERIVWAHLVAACQEHGMYIALDDELWDTTNPDHMRYLDGLVADSIHESGKTRKRIVRDIAAAAEEGRPHGRIAYGLRREYDPDTGELLRQVLGPEHEVETIREIVRLKKAGKSWNWIAGELNRRKIPTPGGHLAGDPVLDDDGNPVIRHGRPVVYRGWTAASLRDLMSRPSLMGKRSYKGRIIEAGGWDRVIEPADWWSINTPSSPRERGLRNGRLRYWLSGVSMCDVCEGRMGVSLARTSRLKYMNYQCQGTYPGASYGHVTRKAETLEAHVEALIVREFSRPDVLVAFRSEVVSEERVEAAHARMLAKRAELEELYREVEAGLVSRRLAQADEQRLMREIRELEQAARPRIVDPMAEALAKPTAEEVLEVWRGWDPEQKRTALLAVTQEVRVLKAGRIGRRKLMPDESVRIVFGPPQMS